MRDCSVLMMVLVAFMTLDVATAEDHEGWTQLSLSTCGVDKFLQSHRECDGRGVIVAVLDTGVDPSIPGLTKTPDGEVKVIDVQDFTGDGDVELDWIRLDPESNKLIRHDDDGAPIEYEPPELPARQVDRERQWWWGVFKESKFVNADQPDLNGNGTTDDEFPVLVTALEGEANDYALCYVDTDIDRSFADEKPLKNYKLAYDTFTFWREKPEKQIRPMTFAVNIFLRQRKVVFHFDNGAHGTHVAGIAAGYRINDQPDFHGVAPGAKLMSLKIGHGGLGGISVTESKKKAFRYAAEYAREHGVPIVMNLSYGVESEIEGYSDIDEFCDEILRKNPYLVFCTSAGNSGPGLSTVGTPAAATEAISVAALMAVDTGRDIAGWQMDDAVVTTFSSRGGELDKPDVATPGWSTSTVPRWVRGGDFWAGTSMASPYAAGLCANLISHAMHRSPGAKVRAWDVKRALWISSRRLDGLTVHDFGYGVPDLSRAAAALEKILVTAQGDPLMNYEISTACVTGFKNRARVSYWRGLWFPCGSERQTFTIRPVFMPTTDQASHTSFARKFELRSHTPWCKVAQDSVYLRSEQSASVHVEYDAAELTEPGLHIGIVEGLWDGMHAFRLINTVVVPYRFTPEQDYTLEFRNQVATGWAPTRWYFAVPPGASSMKVWLSAPEGVESHARAAELFGPLGEAVGWFGALDTNDGTKEIERVFVEELTPGVWELPVFSSRPDEEWPYDLRVKFYGLRSEPAKITEGKVSKPSGELVVANHYEKRVVADVEGRIEGFRMHKEDKFEGLKDELSYSLSLDGRINRIRLKLELEPEHYAETTDIGVMVKDSSGEAIYSSAFARRTHEATVSTRGNTSLEVVIHAGFAIADPERKTPIDVKIDRLLASPVSLEVGHDGDSTINFIPGGAVPIEFKASSALDDVPADHGVVGYLSFEESADGDEVLRVPIEIGG